MSDPALTPDALTLIRDLAGQGMNINRIRGALRRQEGMWFTDDTIISAGAELGFAIVPMAHGRYETGRPLVEKTVGRPVDVVRLVEPGTHRVPPGGFSMLRRGL